jgi:hypothetical protein
MSNQEQVKPAKKAARKHPGTFDDSRGYRALILYCGGTRHYFRLDTFDRKASEKFAREKYAELQAKLDRTRQGLQADTRFSELLAQYRRDELPTRSPGTQRAYHDSL